MLDCQKCGSKFASRSSLRRHIKCRHPVTGSGVATSTKNHRCEFCGQAFVRADALKRHIGSHVVSHMKADRCFLCSKGFRRDDLKRHEAVCVRRHLKKIQNSAKLNTSTAPCVVQGPLEFQWHANTIEAFMTDREASRFEFMRGKTRALDVAAQDFRDLALYAIDRDDLQMCEAIFAAAADLSVSIKDMAKRPNLKLPADAAQCGPDGRFWYLTLILRGERDIDASLHGLIIGRHLRVDISSGSSALHLACHQGLAEVAKSLIAGGADVDPVNEVGESPLCLAVEEGHLDTVRVMLSHGANPDVGSPLSHYMHQKYSRLHEYIPIALVQHGANLAATNEFGGNVLHFAAKHAQLELLDSILARSPPLELFVAVEKVLQNTPLHLAVNHGFLDGITLLVDACAGAVDMEDEEGETPLNLAIINDRDLAVERLLAYANRHSQRTLGRGLATAVALEHELHVHLLIKAGAVLKDVEVIKELEDFFAINGFRKGFIEFLLEERKRVDFLSLNCINMLLKAWIDHAVMYYDSADIDIPSFDLLRQQYIELGKVPGVDAL